MELLRDLKLAVRQLWRHPRFTLLAAGTLALGIGATTAFFSAVEAALLRPLPYADPDRLVAAGETRARDQSGRWTSYPDFLDLRSRTRTLQGLAGFSGGGAAWTTADGAVPVQLAVASGELFELLGVRPALGRLLAPTDDREPVAVATWEFFRSKLGADPSWVGRALTLDGKPVTLVGVLPATFQFAEAGNRDLWEPLPTQADYRERRNLRWLKLVGRLAPGATVAAARAELKDLEATLVSEHPVELEGLTAEVLPLREVLLGGIRPVLLLLFAAVGLLLLVGCANVANLLLVRASARQKDVAVRLALGAPRWRIVRQLLAEAAALALLGGAMGALLAVWLVDALAGAIPADLRAYLPWIADVRVNGWALLFAFGASLAAALLAGLAPALHAVRMEVQPSLNAEGHATAGSARTRLRRALAATEVGLALVLLFGAALVARSLSSVLSSDAGFATSDLIVARVQLPDGKDPELLAGWQRLQAAVQALPGVRAVGTTDMAPLESLGNTIRFRRPGEPPQTNDREGNIRLAGPRYFAALGARLLAGREFGAEDRPDSAPVVIVSRAIADSSFGGDAIGKQLVFTYKPNLPPRTIVGVVDDIKLGGLDSPAPPVIYAPFGQEPGPTVALLIRAPDRVLSPADVRRALVAAEPRALIIGVDRMRDLISRSSWLFARQWPAALASGFALLALLLATVGIYGVMAVSVAQRTREIGIRLALGAVHRDVALLVLRESAAVALIGIVAGGAGALACARLLRGLLYGIGPSDPVALAATAAVLGAATLLASWLPARRAARVLPTEALR